MTDIRVNAVRYCFCDGKPQLEPCSSFRDADVIVSDSYCDGEYSLMLEFINTYANVSVMISGSVDKPFGDGRSEVRLVIGDHTAVFPVDCACAGYIIEVLGNKPIKEINAFTVLNNRSVLMDLYSKCIKEFISVALELTQPIVWDSPQ